MSAKARHLRSMLGIGLLLVTATVVSAGSLKFEHVMNIGSEGLDRGRFKYVEDFCFGKNGHLLVTDASDGTSGKFPTRFGSKGDDDADSGRSIRGTAYQLNKRTLRSQRPSGRYRCDGGHRHRAPRAFSQKAPALDLIQGWIPVFSPCWRSAQDLDARRDTPMNHS